jgi:hypothetical protein
MKIEGKVDGWPLEGLLEVQPPESAEPAGATHFAPSQIDPALQSSVLTQAVLQPLASQR